MTSQGLQNSQNFEKSIDTVEIVMADTNTIKQGGRYFKGSNACFFIVWSSVNNFVAIPVMSQGLH